MTATDRLRALLDERGVEHYDGTERTLWGYEQTGENTGIYRFAASEISGGFLQFDMFRITPEQAVETTLGRETCRMTRIENEKRILCGWVECSECGPVYPPAAEGIQDAIRFCPYCGRRVVA